MLSCTGRIYLFKIRCNMTIQRADLAWGGCRGQSGPSCMQSVQEDVLSCKHAARTQLLIKFRFEPEWWSQRLDSVVLMDFLQLRMCDGWG